MRESPCFAVTAVRASHQTSSQWISRNSGCCPSKPNAGRPRQRSSSSTVKMVTLTRETANGTVKRVVVTGTGLVSCFGTDPDTYYDALLAGKSGVRKVSAFDVDGWSTDFAAYIDMKDVDTDPYVQPKLLRRLDPVLTYALVAGKKALESAGIGVGTDAFEELQKEKCGVLCGSGMGGLNIYSEGVEKLHTRGHKKMSPFFIPYAITNMVSHRALC